MFERYGRPKVMDEHGCQLQVARIASGQRSFKLTVMNLSNASTTTS